MGKPDPDRARSTDVWLPEAVKPRSPSKQDGDAAIADPTGTGSGSIPEPPPSEARHWLLDESSSASRKKGNESATPPRRNGTAAEQTADKPAENRQTSASDVSDSKLIEAEQTLAEQRIRIAELETRLTDREREFKQRLDQREAEYAEGLRELNQALKEREADVLEQAKQREEELQRRIEELESKLKEAQNQTAPEPHFRPRSPDKPGPPTINDVTFEQLRDLGLSVTLSARVIAYRDSHDGFDSLDQLDEVPGVPADVKGLLKEELELG